LIFEIAGTDFSKQYLTPQRILAVQEQLLGFINEQVIQTISHSTKNPSHRSRVSTTTFAAKEEKPTKEESAWFRFLG
jgi:hypothetical protein